MSGSTCRKLTPASVWRPLLLIVLLAAQTEGDIGYDYEDAYDYEEGNARSTCADDVIARVQIE